VSRCSPSRTSLSNVILILDIFYVSDVLYMIPIDCLQARCFFVMSYAEMMTHTRAHLLLRGTAD
jgi:hypothetical protein